MPTDLLSALEELRARLDLLALPLDEPDAPAARRSRGEAVHQLDDYVVPRLRSLDAPVLTVVGGSTGAGKSTLVNSIVGQEVSRPGVIRPTTRSPVLVHHPGDAAWFQGQRILPGLARTTGVASSAASGDTEALHLVGSDTLPVGLALLDAPDIDSVVARNRELAAQLLAAADLWVFVTTAARYADAVPWEFLREAAARSAAVAVVLDRVPDRARAEVTAHLAQMLAAQGLGTAPLFVVAEVAHLGADGLLPVDAIAPVREWLLGLAADANARAAVVRQTLAGAVTALADRVPALADAADAQAAAQERLRAAVDVAYETAVDEVVDATRDGSLLRGEVLARWQDFVGTGEFFRSLEASVGRLRDRLSAALRGEPQPVAEVEQAIESGLESLVLDHGDQAAAAAARLWRADPAGAGLVSPGLDRASPELRAGTAAAVRAWQGAVLDLVRSEGQGRRTTARFLSLGLNGTAVALMVVVFASTGGVTGLEIGIAGGSAVVGQRVLEAVFGDEAVRRMADLARADLRGRVEAVYAVEAARFTGRLEALSVDPAAGVGLRAAADRVRSAR